MAHRRSVRQLKELHSSNRDDLICIRVGDDGSQGAEVAQVLLADPL